MNKKRSLSWIICSMLMIIMSVFVFRIAIYRTLLNENWIANLQDQYKFYQRIQTFTNEELASVLITYHVPVEILNSFLTEEAVKLISREQMVELLKYNRRETDVFPSFNVDTLMINFEQRLINNVSDLPTLSSVEFQNLKKGVEGVLYKNLSIVNYETYRSSHYLNFYSKIMNFLEIPYFMSLCLILIISLVGAIIYIWRHQILNVFYYTSVAILGGGTLLLAVFLSLHKVRYYGQGLDIHTMRIQLYILNFNEFFKSLYTAGMYLMFGGFIVFLITWLIKETKQMSLGNFFKTTI